ncbi:hypothetical protein D3C75_1130320 [compost metagenome]
MNQYRALEYVWDNIFGMVGFEDIATKYFTSVPSSSDEVRQKYLIEASEFVNQIFDKKIGEIGQLGHASLLTHLTAKGQLNQKI